MRQVVFTCPTTGRTARSLMVEFETDPLEGIDAADCPECGRVHIVLRQTGKPPTATSEPAFGWSPALPTFRYATRRAS